MVTKADCWLIDLTDVGEVMKELEELRDTYLRSQERFSAAIAGIDPILLETEPAVGSWSARDVAGHLADWQTESLHAARHILGGPRRRGQPIKDIPRFNAMSAALRGTDPWVHTEADYRASCRQVLAFLDELQSEQLDAIGPFASGRVGRLRELLTNLIRHHEEHAAQLETWRLRRTGARIEEYPS